MCRFNRNYQVSLGNAIGMMNLFYLVSFSLQRSILLYAVFCRGLFE